MSFYRSEDMEYYKLIMPHHSAWNTLNYLGKYGLIHVMPNKNIKTIKPFAANIKTCDEDLLKIKKIQKFILQRQYGNSREFISSQQLVDLNKMWQIHDKSDGIERSRFLQVDQQVNNIWDYQQKILKRKQEIKENLNFYRQNLAIIQAGKKEYGDAFFQINSSFYDNPEHVSIFGLNDLEIKAIVVDDKNLISIKRAITRITRGNSFMSESKFKDLFPKTYPSEEQKNVLFIVYPSKKSSIMDKKVVKIIDIYCPKWSNYVLPQTFSNFRQKYSQLQRQYQQAQKLFDMNQNQNKIFLQSLQGKVEGKNINQLEYYKYYIVKERQIFCQLNQMKSLQNYLQADVFIRKQDVEQVMQILYKVSSEMNTPAGNLIRQQLPRKLPTYFRLNDFKIPAQQITNTYGTPKYKQANPSFFTLVTFPFLFGVMFGDIAHGSIAFLFGVYLLFQSSNSSNSIIRALFPYRYLITLMGFFAIYCGFIYNDFLSISLNLFGSCYNIAQGKPAQPIHKTSSDCVYPFGLDPTWAVSSNYLNYVNSLKMKISVIIAVVHMLLGVLVKASNAIYFKNKLVFIFQFIPQLVFMVVFFGYMDFLIVYKWLKNWNLYDPHAPSIITTMINLPLKVGKTDKCCGGQPLWGSVGNTSQDSIQFILLITGMVCIPLMLLPKPIIQICTAKSHHPPNRPISGQDQPPVENPAIPRSQQVQVNNEIINKQIRQNKRDKSFEEEHDAGQIFVHQLIQTIQYVLGCISNTASYLRLWALSLAHSQLSQVFFQKTIESGLVKGKIGIPILLLAFPILASATFGVLLCMDSMQCFLHTLRLHWVQFQNKFYKGDGFQFQPMDFNKRVKEIVAKSA